jgi:hypothetical protein
MVLNFPPPIPTFDDDWRCGCGAGPWRKNERGVKVGNITNVQRDGRDNVMCLACAGIEPGTTGVYDTPRRTVIEP